MSASIQKFKLVESIDYKIPSFDDREAFVLSSKALVPHLFTPYPYPSLNIFTPHCDVFYLIQQREIAPFFSDNRWSVSIDSNLRALCDRVSTLEAAFDRFVIGGDQKYTWASEIRRSGHQIKHKRTTVIKAGSGHRRDSGRRISRKLVIELDRDGQLKNRESSTDIEKPKKAKASFLNTYGAKSSSTCDSDKGKNHDHHHQKGKKNKERSVYRNEKRTPEPGRRLVEIEQSSNHAASLLNQAFARRSGSVRRIKGKRIDMSPMDAALFIQLSFRAFLIRRSKALRAIRELAVSKAKLKEIRESFNTFSYRTRVARDAEERQKFSEKIIVLLLTIDAVEGVDVLVRASKRSMVVELEAILDAVDPRPEERLSLKRRAFDMPDGVLHGDVAKVVERLIEHVDGGSSSSSGGTAV